MKIILLFIWSHRPSQLCCTNKRRMVSVFWAYISIPLIHISSGVHSRQQTLPEVITYHWNIEWWLCIEHISCWCLFLNTSLATYHSNMGVWLRRMTTYGHMIWVDIFYLVLLVRSFYWSVAQFGLMHGSCNEWSEKGVGSTQTWMWSACEASQRKAAPSYFNFEDGAAAPDQTAVTGR